MFRHRNKWLRRGVALALALGLGATIGGLSRLLDISTPMTYAIVGALLALFVVLVPPAFGLVQLRVSIEDEGAVESEEPAVVAHDHVDWITAPESRDVVLLVYGRNQGVLPPENPVILGTGGTVLPGAFWRGDSLGAC